MNRKIQFFSLLILAIAASSSIKAQNLLFKKYKDGSQLSFVITDIRKLTFSSGKMSITFRSGKTEIDSIKLVRYLSFIDYYPLNYSALNASLDLANTALKTVRKGQYIQSDYDIFVNAIATANDAKNLPKITQIQIDNANAAIAAATKTFKATLTDAPLVESILNSSSIVFPSPTSNDLTFKYQSNNDDIVYIRIVDQLGQTVLILNHENVKGENTVTFSLSQLSAGIYIITNGLDSKEFVKK